MLMRKILAVALAALFAGLAGQSAPAQSPGKGKLTYPEKFSMTIGFKIEPDGSLSNVKVLKSSGRPELDRRAITLVNGVGNRQALAQLADLTSTSVKVDFTRTTAGLLFSGLAPNAEAAKLKAQMIGLAVRAAQAQGGGNDGMELLSQMKVSTQANRLDVALSMPRERAIQMIEARQ